MLHISIFDWKVVWENLLSNVESNSKFYVVSIPIYDKFGFNTNLGRNSYILCNKIHILRTFVIIQERKWVQHPERHWRSICCNKSQYSIYLFYFGHWSLCEFCADIIVFITHYFWSFARRFIKLMNDRLTIVGSFSLLTHNIPKISRLSASVRFIESPFCIFVTLDSKSKCSKILALGAICLKSIEHSWSLAPWTQHFFVASFNASN